VTLWPLDCCGNLHSSVVEYWIRSGAAGVLVASCPPRDCRSREGPKWLEERLQHGREAELQERVDRRRVRVVHAAEAESRLVLHALAAFRVDLAALALAEREAAIELETACEPPPAQAAS
jgi:coenzyme F420-reducing hydrogenase delta subunit